MIPHSRLIFAPMRNGFLWWQWGPFPSSPTNFLWRGR